MYNIFATRIHEAEVLLSPFFASLKPSSSFSSLAESFPFFGGGIPPLSSVIPCLKIERAQTFTYKRCAKKGKNDATGLAMAN